MQPSDLIFGFMEPSQDEDIPSGFAITSRQTFRTEQCMSDNYPDAFYDIFQTWQEMGIYECMESVFEYPEERRQYIERYLSIWGIQRSPEFEGFLRELA
jgi:sialic acid synthase SpsE